MSLVSVSGSILIKTTLMKSSTEAFWCYPDCVLVKTSTDNGCWQNKRRSDIQSSGSLYTFKVIYYTSCSQEASFFWKICFHYSGRSNLAEENGFPEFYESNLTEARFEIIGASLSEPHTSVVYGTTCID